MGTGKRLQRVLRVLCGGVAVLLTASGCATTESALARETRLKQARSHFEIGVDHLQRGRYAEGLQEFLTAESFDPSSPKIQIGLAEAYLHRGRAAEAEAHLLRALEIDPGSHDARLNLSALYLETGRYEDSAEHARILADDPTFPAVWRAYTNLAVAEISLERYAEAREHLDRALAYNRSYWPAYLTLGILEQAVGHPQEAIAAFEQALEKNPRPAARAEVNHRMAVAYVSLGRRDKAVSHLMTAVAQAPDGEWGRKSAKYLETLR